uniref:Phosphoglycolate phosphatase n=1 Tax=Chlamydomonas euryale TaxID=1486919 RepID=A0A7R9VZM5_9CHLO|mmetsp:Transcript_8103/g.24431  ORF Transcript_8103/g.24431 Transcript_8103/m.24431 type:complete len:278 (+) Transcript_8103:1026-1859(+)
MLFMCDARTPGIVTTSWVSSQGKKVFFVTNDATLSRQGHLKKLQAMGLKASLEEIYGSAFAAALFLKSKKFQRKAYVIGEGGLMEELRAMGIPALGGPADATAVVDFDADEPFVDVDPDVGAVVVGMDRGLNYYKVQYSLTCMLQNKDCMFLATNTDSRSYFSMTQEWAGAGTMVGALIGASEAEPLVVGKPSSFLLDTICRASGVAKEQMCIVGDRLDTDVLWGNRSGCGTLLVLSGATSEAMLKSPENKVHPTYYLDNIGGLLTIRDKLSSCVVS